MNYYFLVEGEKTEIIFYPKIMKWLSPDYHQVENIFEINHNTFYVFSGLGHPRIFEKMKKALEDINDINSQSKHTKIHIDILFLVIDADKYPSLESAEQSVKDHLKNYSDDIKMAKVKVIPIIQQQCVESWFLGNSNIMPKNISDDFKKYVDYYNVGAKDPELMLSPDNRTNGQYAFAYLKEMAKQNGLKYSKSNIDDVSSDECIKTIYKRCNKTNHLKTFKKLIDTLQKYNPLEHL